MFSEFGLEDVIFLPYGLLIHAFMESRGKMNPSNWDEELRLLREHIKQKLEEDARIIVTEEIEKILGRVKILTQYDLSDSNQYEWFIQRDNK